MTVSLAKSDDEIKQLPLVELAFELLKAKTEPIYFREMMEEIRQLRNMTEDEAMEVIARLYTEINIDGRFIHLGQNVWGLRRWFPVEKANERPQSSKRFVRSSGDAFSDDDELLDDYDEEEAAEDLDESEEDAVVPGFDSPDADDDSFDEADDTDDVEDSDDDFDGDDDEELDDEFADESEEETDDELDDANPDEEEED
ncbi:DNA-directed RNA polymerase subunit delta [Alicyclobacillus curvatus]|jgi:DNA-directed RNA polymerase subunit delta|nr:DNA-directed RNA polymerase subunit delta [Alicyclobacillus curvatus]